MDEIKKTKCGRKAFPPEKVRSYPLRVALKDSEAKILQAIADEKSITISEVVRYVLFNQEVNHENS